MSSEIFPDDSIFVTNNTIYFYDNSKNSSSVAQAVFSGSAINEGSVLVAKFSASASNQGTVTTATFTGGAVNEGTATNAQFLENSENQGDATLSFFLDSAANSGNAATATFFDNATNTGIIFTKGTFLDSTSNTGTVLGIAEVAATASVPLETVTGTVTSYTPEGREGAYRDAYYENNVIKNSYTNNLPQLVQDKINYYCTYSNGIATPAQGAYSTGAFEAGKKLVRQGISRAIDNNLWYRYNSTSGAAPQQITNTVFPEADMFNYAGVNAYYITLSNSVATPAEGAFANGYYTQGRVAVTGNFTYFSEGKWYSYIGSRAANGAFIWTVVLMTGTKEVDTGTYHYYILGERATTFSSNTPVLIKDSIDRYAVFSNGSGILANGVINGKVYSSGYFLYNNLPNVNLGGDGKWYVTIDNNTELYTGALSSGYAVNGEISNTYTNATPQQAANNGKYYTYLNGTSSVANGPYSTGWFVGGGNLNTQTKSASSPWYHKLNDIEFRYKIPAVAKAKDDDLYYMYSDNTGLPVSLGPTNKFLNKPYYEKLLDRFVIISQDKTTAFIANGVYSNGYFVGGVWSNQLMRIPTEAIDAPGIKYYHSPYTWERAHGRLITGKYDFGVKDETYTSEGIELSYEDIVPGQGWDPDNWYVFQGDVAYWYTFTNGVAARAEGIFDGTPYVNGLPRECGFFTSNGRQLICGDNGITFEFRPGAFSGGYYNENGEIVSYTGVSTAQDDDIPYYYVDGQPTQATMSFGIFGPSGALATEVFDARMTEDTGEIIFFSEGYINTSINGEVLTSAYGYLFFVEGRVVSGAYSEGYFSNGSRVDFTGGPVPAEDTGEPTCYAGGYPTPCE